jgi:MFS superfamily sulfate permease-like transporter
MFTAFLRRVLRRAESMEMDAGAQIAPSSADARAGLIVFLVALPLCLGIATASGAPPLAGLIAGVVGGTVVALASGAQLSVAGPAAGLTTVVLAGIQGLGFPSFLTAVMIAGGLQVLMGVCGFGRFVQLVPSPVIRGMLAAIGLILVLKQLPHAVGWDLDPEGDMSFVQSDGHTTFSELRYALSGLHPGAVVVSLCSAIGLFAWRDYGSVRLTRYAPRELMCVISGLLAAWFLRGNSLALSSDHLVNIPPVAGLSGVAELWTRPAMGGFSAFPVWKLAITLALVASIESLLSTEATDRLDLFRRRTPSNRELVAQGLGNVTSGFLGGLPVTAVVVRSFTNVQAGGRTRWSSVLHGVLLLAATLGLASLLNLIPLSALAVVLLMVGYKLTSPTVYKQMWQLGLHQFVPFIVTIFATLFTDLSQDISFLHKGRLRAALQTPFNYRYLVLDGTRVRHVDPEILEMLRELEADQGSRRVELSIKRSMAALHEFFREVRA